MAAGMCAVLSGVACSRSDAISRRVASGAFASA